MRLLALSGLTLVATLVSASPALAETFSGSQSNWPKAAFDVGTNAYNPSPARMGVVYDDAASLIVTSVDLARPLSDTSARSFSFYFTLAQSQAGSGCDDTAHLTPLAYFSGSVSDSGADASVSFDANSGYTSASPVP
jgi:hypothetical protein